MNPPQIDPHRDCPLCDRLAGFRNLYREKEPEWFNAPVPSFGDPEAQLIIVGLAPGLRGANRTGRPFTGDFAGDLLYSTLLTFGFAKGAYEARPDDTLKLTDCLITNAVRCVPPENKPTTDEIRNCLPFLLSQLSALPNMRAVLALGRIAHDSMVTAYGYKKSAFKFGHGARHAIADGITLFDSYHCSRYNTNTGRLTTEMFHNVFSDIRTMLG